MPHDTKHTHNRKRKGIRALEKNKIVRLVQHVVYAMRQQERRVRERVGQGIWQRQLRQQQNETNNNKISLRVQRRK